MAPEGVKINAVKAEVQAELTDAISSLYSDPTHADLTIICGDRTFKVHKAVVCSRSPYFRKACSGSFKEASEGIITLKTAEDLKDAEAWETDDPEAIDLLLHYIYRSDYPNDEVSGLLLVDAKVFAAATKFQVSALQKLSALKFETKLRSVTAENPSRTTDLAQAIKVVFEATPDDVTDLRDAVSDGLLRDSKLMESVAISQAIQEIKGLTYELLMKAAAVTVNAAGIKQCYRCKNSKARRCKKCKIVLPECYGCVHYRARVIQCPACDAEMWQNVAVVPGDAEGRWKVNEDEEEEEEEEEEED